MSLLEDNLAALARRQPELVERLRAAADLPAGALAPAARCGHTLRIQSEAGGEISLASRADPLREADRIVEGKKLGPLDTAVVLGFGLGYHVAALLRAAEKGARAIVVERDLAVARAALSATPIDDILPPEAHLIAGLEPALVGKELRRSTEAVLSTRLLLVSHPPSLQAAPAYYQEVLRLVSEVMKVGELGFRTSFVLARRGFENRLLNLADYVLTSGVAPFQDRWRGYPGVVVSSGPSLAKNVHLLERFAGRAAIVAVSSSLRKLLAHGIEPDFTVILDWSNISRRYFDDVPADQAQRVPIVCDPRASGAAVAAYPGPKIFPNDAAIDLLLGRLARPLGSLDFGTTVAHTAFSFVQALGCDPIIFVGQDLAYPHGLTHAPGTPFYNQMMAEVSRFRSFETIELEAILRERGTFCKLPGIEEPLVYASNTWLTYLRQFEDRFRAAKQKIVDATEGGARKAAAETIPLAEAMARYLRGEAPAHVRSWPGAPTDADRPGALARAREELVLRHAELGELASIYDDLGASLRRVRTRLRKNRDANDAVREVHATRKRLDEPRFARLYLALRDLATSDDYIRMRQDRRIDAHAKGRERQALEAERDLEFVRALREAAVWLRPLLLETADRLALRMPCG